MDINNFALDKEFFGFNQYRRSAKSNLDFMYLNAIEDSSEYKKALRDHNEMVDNIKESGLSQSEMDKQLKAEQRRFDLQVVKITGGQIVEGAGKAASKLDTLFTKATNALGINTTNETKSSGKAPVNIKYDDKDAKTSSNTTYWIVAGAVLVAGIGFWIYKTK